MTLQDRINILKEAWPSGMLAREISHLTGWSMHEVYIYRRKVGLPRRKVSGVYVDTVAETHWKGTVFNQQELRRILREKREAESIKAKEEIRKRDLAKQAAAAAVMSEREKLRETALALRDEGAGVEEIARALHAPVSRINRWFSL